MTKKLQYIILTVLLISLSCDEKFIIVNCNDCFVDEPVSAEVTVKLDPKIVGDVILRVYLGNIEDNILMNTYYPSIEEIQVKLVLNRKYTLSATYTNDKGNVCIVVDSVYPHVKYDTQQCEMPCYYVYNDKVNLKLKYRNY